VIDDYASEFRGVRLKKTNFSATHPLFPAWNERRAQRVAAKMLVVADGGGDGCGRAAVWIIILPDQATLARSAWLREGMGGVPRRRLFVVPISPSATTLLDRRVRQTRSSTARRGAWLLASFGLSRTHQLGANGRTGSSAAYGTFSKTQNGRQIIDVLPTLVRGGG